jgi:hypothetical protein
MQAPLLSGATRTALKADPELHQDIVTALSGLCGVEQIDYDSVQRFRRSPGRE